MFAHFTPRAAAIGLLIAVIHSPANATGIDRTPPAGGICQQAIKSAESHAGIPEHLLHAIAMVESGISVGSGQSRVPWPWTVMSQGKGRYFKNRDAAVKVVRELLQRGVYNIDVGCMQINLRYHGMAFQSLEEAFDPVVNVAYAATFLKDLQGRHGTWDKAVKHYHSATPSRNGPYTQKVRAELIALKKTGEPMTSTAHTRFSRALAQSAAQPKTAIPKAQPVPKQVAVQPPQSPDGSRQQQSYLKIAQWPPQSYKSQQQAEFHARARVLYPTSTEAATTPTQ